MKRITSKKKKKSRTLLAKIIMLFILIILAISAIIVSGICNIKKINISINIENPKIQVNEIESLSGLTIGQNMFKKSKKQIIDNIKKNTYVEDVKISRRLNGTISININQREVKYIINYAESYIYIDGQGYILELSSEPQNVPAILGVTTDLSNITSDTEEKTIRLNDVDLKKLSTVNSIMENAKTNDIDGIITRIDMANDKDYIVYLDSENKIVYLGNCSDLNTRILYVKSIVREEAGRKGEIFVNGNLNSSYVYFKEGV